MCNIKRKHTQCSAGIDMCGGEPTLSTRLLPDVPYLLFSPASLMLAELSPTAGVEEVVSAVRTTLSEQGTLQQLRAQLRAHVYTALLEKTPASTPAHDLGASSNDRLALALIEDFLRFHNLSSTASTAEG